MDSDHGPRDPDQALILDGIRALHDRMDELEHRMAPGERPGPRAVPAWKRPTQGEARWQAALAVGVAVALQYALPGRLVLVHPTWLLPTLEGLLLIVLVMANPRRINIESRALRLLGLTLAALLSLANAWSVGALVVGLVQGTQGGSPGSLLITGGAIWLTNVIVFGLWYWEFDRGGPVARAHADRMYPDFLFAQMATPQLAAPDWEPGLQRLPVPVLHQRRRVQPHGRAAAVPLGQDGHDGPGQRLDRDRRPGRGPRRQHPQVASDDVFLPLVRP